jgi:hypothetical protein
MMWLTKIYFFTGYTEIATGFRQDEELNPFYCPNPSFNDKVCFLLLFLLSLLFYPIFSFFVFLTFYFFPFYLLQIHAVIVVVSATTVGSTAEMSKLNEFYAFLTSRGTPSPLSSFSACNRIFLMSGYKFLVNFTYSLRHLVLLPPPLFSPH